MRSFIIALFVLASVKVSAMCASSGIWCWPSGTTIKPNAIIMLEFYGTSQAIAEGLNGKYPVYLKSSTEKIGLRVTEICKGEFQLTQALLKPERALTPGVQYQLMIDSLFAKDDNIRQWSDEKKGYVPVSWTATTTGDHILPEWKQFPVFKTKTYTRYGCGPAKWVHFDMAFSDQSDVLVRTTVSDIATGKTSTYYLIPKEGKLMVGHGMCSGAFSFNKGKEYNVVFSLLDASGNAGCEQTAAIRFSQPEPEDSGWQG